ncbi:Hypothetical predicted protein [Cloeon dipterum]|nr:Hypothetical predicted protein [Cloeon dipterum]
MYPVFELLLDISTTLKIMDVTGFMSFCPHDLKYDVFRDLVIKIAKDAPKIEELVLLDNTEELNEVECSLDRTLLEEFGKLKQLRVLVVHEPLCFNADELQKLGQGLPSLRFLDINLLFNSQLPTTEQLLSLSHLRVFLFSLDADLTRSLQFASCCVDHLPNLQAVYELASEFGSHQEFEFSDEAANPGTSNLTHLSVFSSYNFRNCIDVKFPRVTHLKIECIGDFPEQNLQPLLKFKRVKSLQLNIGYSKAMLDFSLMFFKCYGMKLVELSVECRLTNVFFTLEQISEDCPKLEKLKLWCREINKCESQKMDNLFPLFPNLKELELHLTDEISNNGYKGILSKILQSPRLEKVKLIGSTKDSKDLYAAISKVDSGLILGQLKTLIIDMNCFNMASLNQIFFKYYIELIKVAKVFLKKLNSVKFSLNCFEDYATVARSLARGRVNEGTFFVNYDFSNELFVDWFVDEELICILDECEN